jgi:hypothetical protein
MCESLRLRVNMRPARGRRIPANNHRKEVTDPAATI